MKQAFPPHRRGLAALVPTLALLAVPAFAQDVPASAPQQTAPVTPPPVVPTAPVQTAPVQSAPAQTAPVQTMETPPVEAPPPPDATPARAAPHAVRAPTATRSVTQRTSSASH